MNDPAKTRCGHDAFFAGHQVCAHLLEDADRSFYRVFLTAEAGDEATRFVLACPACATASPAELQGLLQPVCPSCFHKTHLGHCLGNLGKPNERVRETGLRFEHRWVQGRHAVPLLGLTTGTATSDWIALDERLTLLRWNLESGEQAEFTELRAELNGLKDDGNLRLHTSSDARFVAVVQDRAGQGLVFDLLERRVTLQLSRGSYHTEQTEFPIAFFELDGQTHLIHATEWNRVDVSLPATGQLLTHRVIAPYEQVSKAPEHYLDYFYGALVVSPGAWHVASDGWVWHPWGVAKVWDLQAWMRGDVWASEDDGHSVGGISYFWGHGICFASNETLLAWGIGSDDHWIAPGVRVYNVLTEQQTEEFFGPDLRPRLESALHKPGLIVDEYLFAFAFGRGIGVWDVAMGERVAFDATFCPVAYQPQTKTFINVVEGNLQLSRLVDSGLEA